MTMRLYKGSVNQIGYLVLAGSAPGACKKLLKKYFSCADLDLDPSGKVEKERRKIAEDHLWLNVNIATKEDLKMMNDVIEGMKP